MTAPGTLAAHPLIPIRDRLAGVLRTLEMLRARDTGPEPDVLLVLEDVLADQIDDLQEIADRETPEPPRD